MQVHTPVPLQLPKIRVFQILYKVDGIVRVFISVLRHALA